MMSSDERAARTGGARVVRIARGFIDPASRPRYVAALRRRLRDGVGTVAAQRGRVGERCLVCGSSQLATRTVTNARDPSKTFTVRRCGDCGYVANPDNFNDYKVYESVKQFPLARRVGTLEKPGREYRMVQMGADILHGRDVDVLVYGPGRSMDFVHMAKLPRVRRVAIGDVVNLHGVEGFVDVTDGAKERFDLVVASEVIEHFTDPRGDFAQLFGFVATEGLLVCSTNIYDGGDLAKHNYLFIKGHTSYYSPRAIERIARDAGFFFDFRVPQSATTYAGPRKRYVLFTRSAGRLQDIARYFGDHCYAPSEL